MCWILALMLLRAKRYDSIPVIRSNSVNIRIVLRDEPKACWLNIWKRPGNPGKSRVRSLLTPSFDIRWLLQVRNRSLFLAVYYYSITGRKDIAIILLVVTQLL